MEHSFLGKGLKFPIQVNPSTGRFVVAEGNQSVKESVYLILMTNQGERWLNPEFGSQLLSYTFMDTSLTMFNLLASDIRGILTSQEPRIENIIVNIDTTERVDCLIVNIDYTVIETNTAENFVFPFYITSMGDLFDEEGGDF
ncbi:MAG: GPW/gp25 family protein [Oscillospiraceae bacterium]|nr:GPW/gp25 family protein [Oscillospiraceae bacterium]